MKAEKTLGDIREAVVVKEGLRIPLRKVLDIFAVMNNADQVEVEFDNYLICDDLIFNKKCLEPHVDAFNLLNKQVPEYRKYLRAHESAKNKFFGESDKLEEERKRIEKAYIQAKEAEMDRLDKVNEELDRVVTIEHIRLIDRRNAQNEPTVKTKTSKGLAFVAAISIFFK